MRSIIRYSISLGVGLIVTVLAAELATTDHLIVLSLVPLYGAATSMLLAHKRRWLSLSRGSSSRSAKKRGATIGGVGAFTGSLLLRASIPVGLAGYGLLILGMAGAIADMDES
jgi:hypothetical protein